MRDIRSTRSLEAALQFIKSSSDIPSDHKAVVIDLLTSALRALDAQYLEDRTAAVRESTAWQEEETREVRAFLDGKIANSWQQADELLMHLANRLGRDPGHVRTKATELGFGESIDYRLAKLSERARKEK